MTTQANAEKTGTGGRRRSGDERRLRVADAALSVLAEQGARGLTHRAVDEAAGLPQGATSNVFRSRAALLEGALERHAAIDFAATGPGADDPAPLPPLSREQAAHLVSAGVESVLGQRPRTVARYELLLESTRRDELQAPIEAARARFASAASRLLAATGCGTPERHAAQLLAVLDGIVIAELQGSAAALDHEAIEELVHRTLASC